MRSLLSGASAMLCLSLPGMAGACPACQGVVYAEVLSDFWQNLCIAAGPFAVFTIIAALAYRVR